MSPHQALSDSVSPAAEVGPPKTTPPKKRQLLVIGGAMLAIMLVLAFASVVMDSSADTAGQEQLALNNDNGDTVGGEASAEDPAADASEIEEPGPLSDDGSYQALTDSWSTFSELNEAYGPPQSDDTVPAYGWLRDNFGPMITGSPTQRRALADEAAEYTELFRAAKLQLEELQVSPAYVSDRDQLLAIYEIATRRADSYEQISDYAIDHRIEEWRALQAELGTKEMKVELLGALSSYSPPSTP
ncbi:MAG: hypothetical protein U1E26_04010 [Coriobacteriia bacterium]|nr:hypothetical protein [Coriobacteriia bacterium]